MADTDGAAIPANGLTLQGGTVRQVDSTVDAALTHAALADQSGHKVNGAETDAKPSGVARTFAYNAASPYADDLAPCTCHGRGTVACAFDRLPYLGADTDTPTLDDVMNRVVVSHRWMGANFRNLLERMPAYLLPLFSFSGLTRLHNNWHCDRAMSMRNFPATKPSITTPTAPFANTWRTGFIPP